MQKRFAAKKKSHEVPWSVPRLGSSSGKKPQLALSWISTRRKMLPTTFLFFKLNSFPLHSTQKLKRQNKNVARKTFYASWKSSFMGKTNLQIAGRKVHIACHLKCSWFIRLCCEVRAWKTENVWYLLYRSILFYNCNWISFQSPVIFVNPFSIRRLFSR